MNLIVLLVACAGVFAWLNYKTVPRAREHFAKSTGADKIARSTKLAGLEIVRYLALLLTAGAALTVLLGLAISLSGGSTTDAVASSLARLNSIKNAIDAFSLWFGLIAAALIAFGLWRLVRAKTEHRTREALEKAISLERERVRAARDSGEWEDLPPSAEMEAIAKEMAELDEFSKAVDAAIAEGVEKTDQGTPLPEMQQRVQSRMQELAADHANADEYRRMNINWHPPELDPPPPETRKEKIQAFFFSRGLLNSMNGIARVGFVVGMLLLVPTLLAVPMTGLGPAVTERSVKLEELYVSLRAEDARKSWEAASAQGGAAAKLTEEDENTLDTLAAAYEQSVATSLVAVMGRSAAAAAPAAIAAHHARQAILSEFAHHADPGHPRPHLVTPEHAPPLHATAASEYRHDADRRKPRTPEGMAFRERLRKEVAQGSGETWAKFKQAAHSGAASFLKPARAAELEAALLSRMVGVTGVELPHTAGDAALRKTVGADSVSQAARSRVYDTRSREFMTTLARTGNIESAMSASTARPGGASRLFTTAEASAVKSVATHVPRVEDIGRHIQMAPPTLARAQLAGVDLAAARRAGENVTTRLYGSAGAARPIEALHSFNSFFPGHAATGAAAGAAGAKIASAPGNFHHSRSFTALRGSRRIGGVLIGREPEKGAPALDFNGIDWKIENSLATIRLRNGKGEFVTVGAFRPGIVHHALAYAADGRPVTVTMTTASPLQELKINVHPSLEDTPLGCHAIEIDRFVDTLTSSNPALGRMRTEANGLVQGYNLLYRTAWSRMILSDPGRRWLQARPDGVSRALQRRAEEERRETTEESKADEVLLALKTPAAALDPKRTPLAAKPEFFSRVVTGIVDTCVRQSQGSFQRFDACAGEQSAKMESSQLSKEPAWDAPPPAFEQWSGVRENGYKLDSALAFASLKSAAGNELWPFEFMVQIAFASPPYGISKNGKWYEDDPAVDNHVDATPWEFPTLRDPLQAGMAAAMKSGAGPAARWNDTLGALREFAVLQRLFRAALTGGLGPNFPADRLAALIKETAKLKPRGQRTPRWNVRQGAVEMRFMQRLAMGTRLGLLDKENKAVADKAAACLKRHSALTPAAMSNMSVADWDAACRWDALEPATAQMSGQSLSFAENLARQSVIVSETRKMRKALKVDDDLAFAGKGCAAP